MILTVTCNPAVDLTYRVDRLAPGDVHRVREVHARPGGKGVNVARVLHQLGEPVTAVGIGTAAFAEAVAASGVTARFVDALPEVRRTLVVHDDAGATSFWEPGPPADPAAAEHLLELVAELLPSATGVVVAGSLPPGVPVDLPTRIATRARAAGLPVVLDLDGPALRHATSAQTGAVLTPNRDELAALTSTADPRTAIREIAMPVVATLGPDGLLAATAEGCWEVRAPQMLSGNPTGAGDAVAAALVRGLARHDEWPALLADAVALGAAAVRHPTAGEVDLDTYRRSRDRATVTVLDPARGGSCR